MGFGKFPVNLFAPRNLCPRAQLLLLECFGVLGFGFGVWGFRFGVWGLRFWGWGLGFGVWGFGFGVWGLGFGVCLDRGVGQVDILDSESVGGCSVRPRILHVPPKGLRCGRYVKRSSPQFRKYGEKRVASSAVKGGCSAARGAESVYKVLADPQGAHLGALCTQRRAQRSPRAL